MLALLKLRELLSTAAVQSDTEANAFNTLGVLNCIIALTVAAGIAFTSGSFDSLIVPVCFIRAG